MTKLTSDLTLALQEFRQRGMQISDINPISALADMVSEKLHKSEIVRDDIQTLLDHLSTDIWDKQADALALQSGLKNQTTNHLDNHRAQLASLPLDKPLYRAVFTAHPVFALQKQNSDALCQAAADSVAGKKSVRPQASYLPRSQVALTEEHDEAMQALSNARRAIRQIQNQLLEQKESDTSSNWRDVLPQMLGVSTWVGYDLDGRSDISWSDSLSLRLREKLQALEIYHKDISDLGYAPLQSIADKIFAEMAACKIDLYKLAALADGPDSFADAANSLTERPNRLISSRALADTIHSIAKTEQNDTKARAILLIAGDIATHGFGMGEIHLRINAVQLRNSMRSVDGRSLSQSHGTASQRILIDRLANRIATEAPWQINFATIDQETATARRQLMLAAQFLKHIDSDQPIRLLIAECERPITYMSALYLAHKLGIADKLDISPLFETTFGLEYGAQMMDQLFAHQVVQDYVHKRGRVAIQLGFSDAGRFMGQMAANLAIERLQIKIMALCAQYFGSDTELLIFNTHGESLGRGCARPTMQDRQDFILTPFARSRATALNLRIHHQSSFQGGDGYRLFGTEALAYASFTNLLLAETKPPSQDWLDDQLYHDNEFSLDLFLALKNWHESLFSDADYGATIDVFGSNLLPKTGSRPAKRVVQAGNERKDPSKIRAIPHNAILQQLGFLAIVISGMGRAAQIDTDRFSEVYTHSPRLQKMMQHIQQAKHLGSLNTMLAYARLTDNGFWVGRAYHGNQHGNQRAFRQLAASLRQSSSAASIRQTVWRLREDLIDLYRLFDGLEMGSARTLGDERITPDLLHAVRIALIMDSLIRVSQVPRFAESNRYSNSDLISAALRLDFETVCTIVEIEFPDITSAERPELAETESYKDGNPSSYADTRADILTPLKQNQFLIRQITQLISALYGAHG